MGHASPRGRTKAEAVAGKRDDDATNETTERNYNNHTCPCLLLVVPPGVSAVAAVLAVCCGKELNDIYAPEFRVRKNVSRRFGKG